MVKKSTSPDLVAGTDYPDDACHLFALRVPVAMWLAIQQRAPRGRYNAWINQTIRERIKREERSQQP